MTSRWLGWAALMLLTGVLTVYLCSQINGLLPPGDWHAMLLTMLFVVIWPALTWLLRSSPSPAFAICCRGFAARIAASRMSTPYLETAL
jgi:hypothetical protein